MGSKKGISRLALGGKVHRVSCPEIVKNEDNRHHTNVGNLGHAITVKIMRGMNHGYTQKVIPSKKKREMVQEKASVGGRSRGRKDGKKRKEVVALTTHDLSTNKTLRSARNGEPENLNKQKTSKGEKKEE